MTLRGIVVTGQGQGRHFTGLHWARQQFIEKLGIAPHPGTLNLRLQDASSRQRWVIRRRGPAELIRASEPGACNARCFQVDLKGAHRAAIVWPQISTYPDDQIELIANVSLRQVLGLVDGAELTIKLTPPAEALRRTVQAFLSAHRVLSLATHGADGPWAASVFYVHLGWSIYFLSAPDSRHSRNLAEQPHVAATVNPDDTNWQEIRGVQLEGTAAMVTNDDEYARALTAYESKYPFVDQPEAPTDLVQALNHVQLYRIVPSRLLWVDNSNGLGHREAVEMLDIKRC